MGKLSAAFVYVYAYLKKSPFDSRPFQSPIQTGEKKQVLHVG